MGTLLSAAAERRQRLAIELHVRFHLLASSGPVSEPTAIIVFGLGLTGYRIIVLSYNSQEILKVPGESMCRAKVTAEGGCPTTINLEAYVAQPPSAGSGMGFGCIFRIS